MIVKTAKGAMLVSSSVAFALALLKFVFGIFSGSVAILASSIDSILDFFVSIFNYFAISTSQQKPTHQFNYGKGKVESIAVIVEGIAIILSGLYILYISIHKIYNQNEVEYLNYSIIMMIISVIVTAILVIFLNNIYKKTKSLIIKTDSLHYKIDLYTNASILLSLIIIQIFKFELLDALLGILIAIYIIYSAYKLMISGFLILLDHALDEELVKKIEEVFNTHEDISDFHYLSTRSSGNINFVDVHVVCEDHEISLMEAHNISDELEDQIKDLDKAISWHITIHLDPYDDSDQIKCPLLQKP